MEAQQALWLVLLEAQATSRHAECVLADPCGIERLGGERVEEREGREGGREGGRGSGGTSVELGSRWMRPERWQAKIKPQSPKLTRTNLIENRLIEIKEILSSRSWRSCGSMKMSTYMNERNRAAEHSTKMVRSLARIHADTVRATLDISPDKRPWNKAQTVFSCAMRETASWFDIRWVPTGIRVSVNSAPSGVLPVLT